MSKFRVLVTRKLPTPTEARLKELFECTLNTSDVPISHSDLRGSIDKYDGLVPTITDRIDAAIINSSKSLKVIANFGAGTDHIDLAAAAANGVCVTNTPDSLTEDTADFAIALIMAVSRRISEGEQLLRAGQWQGWAPTLLRGYRVHGKRLGIIGMGRIGRALAKRSYAGFNMPIHYHNRNRLSLPEEQKFEATYWQSLHEMISHVDFISIHTPYTKESHHLLGREEFAIMKKHCFVINTSRGEVIDEKALIDALQQQQIAGAALDVFAKEPQVPQELIEMKNVVVAPHMASATLEARKDMGDQVVVNLRTFFDDHSPPNRVLTAMVTY